MANIIERIKGNGGKAIGTHHNNPILDTLEYSVEFPNGATKELTVNLIAESMFSKIDQEGYHFSIMSEF